MGKIKWFIIMLIVIALIVFFLYPVDANTNIGINENKPYVSISPPTSTTTSGSITDTNATTECGDNEYLRGDGTCQVISGGSGASSWVFGADTIYNETARVGIRNATPIATASLHVSGGDIAIQNNEWYKLLNSSGVDDGVGFYRTTANAMFLRFLRNSFIYHAADDKDIRYWGSDNLNNYNFKFITGTNTWNAQQKNIDFKYSGVSNDDLFTIDAGASEVGVDGDLHVTGAIFYNGGSLGTSIGLYGEGEEELNVENFYTNKQNYSGYNWIVTGNYNGTEQKNFTIQIGAIENETFYRGVGCKEDASSVEWCTYFNWSNDNGATFSDNILTEAGSYILENKVRFGFGCSTDVGCNFSVGDQFNVTVTPIPIISFRVDTVNDSILSEVNLFNISNQADIGRARVEGFISPTNNIPFNFYDDGSELFLNSTAEAFNLETENSKFILFNEPNAANDWKVAQFFSKEASDVTEFVVTKAGPAHASYFVRSLALVGNGTLVPTGFNCSTYASYVDCSTDGTGPDFYVLDDVEVNGSLYANEEIYINGVAVSSQLGGGSSLWTASGNNIYNDSVAFLGVGTDSPTMWAGSAGIMINGDAVGIQFNDTNEQDWSIYVNSNNFYVRDIGDGNYPFMIEQGTGSVGIGTTTPTYALDIVGNDFYLHDTTHGPYLRVGPRNAAYTHFDTNATSGFYFYQTLTSAVDLNALEDIQVYGQLRDPDTAYVTVNDGLYVQGGVLYAQQQINARADINNDVGGNVAFAESITVTGDVVVTDDTDIQDLMVADAGCIGTSCADPGDNDLRVNGDFLQYEGANNQRGQAYYCDGASASFDTGTECCTAWGLSCADVQGNDAESWTDSHACSNDMAGPYTAYCYI